MKRGVVRTERLFGGAVWSLVSFSDVFAGSRRGRDRGGGVEAGGARGHPGVAREKHRKGNVP